jgi:hypothetical protein
LRCKHCYVFSDQRAPGKISLSQVSHNLNDGRNLPDLRWIYFGGGEPFTQYPLLLKAVQRAKKLEFNVGIETNGYFARTKSAGLRFLRPLAEMGVNEIRVSNDLMHYKNPDKSPASNAIAAARQLEIRTKVRSIPYPNSEIQFRDRKNLETYINENRLMFAGRAAETLASKHKSIDWRTFNECPRKDLCDPQSLFVDAYGFVQICPGISIGNACERPLHTIIQDFELMQHQILHPLQAFGPAGLIKVFNMQSDRKYVGPCHCCYSIRRELIDTFPEQLGPRNVYGF